MRLLRNYVAPRFALSEFLGDAYRLVNRANILELVRAAARARWREQAIDCDVMNRTPGDDPLPDVPLDYMIVAVWRWLTVVDVATDLNREISVVELPEEFRRRFRVGTDRWYDNVCFVVVEPGSVGR